VVLTILATLFSDELFTKALRQFRVIARPASLTQGDPLTVDWTQPQGNRPTYPFERIRACSGGEDRTCRTLVESTPNDGTEIVDTAALSPGSYVIELSALDASSQLVPRVKARSNRFRVTALPSGSASPTPPSPTPSTRVSNPNVTILAKGPGGQYNWTLNLQIVSRTLTINDDPHSATPSTGRFCGVVPEEKIAPLQSIVDGLVLGTAPTAHREVSPGAKSA